MKKQVVVQTKLEVVEPQSIIEEIAEGRNRYNKATMLILRI